MRITTFLFAAASLAIAASASATNEHAYAKGEYAVIQNGLAPNKKMSLAAHGDGEFGHGNFHVWLMAEPAHRRLEALDDISEENNLDTGPDAYHAAWAPDSRHAAVGFRSDRHVVELNLYTIEGRRARLIGGPTLFKEVTSRDVGSDDGMRRSVPEIEWRGADRFVLRENRLFVAENDRLAKPLGRFGKITKMDDGRYSIEFAAEADCVLLPGNRYRVVDLRVGKFDAD